MTAAETTSFVLPDAGVYVIDPDRSTLLYTGRHMFGLGTVRARFTITSGEVRVAADIGSSSVVASVDAGSFSSNSARRDKDVRSAALLDADTYPEIRFRSTALHEHGDLWRLEGDVTAHGSTIPVPVDIHGVARDGNEIRVTARAERLDRLSFGITKARGMVGRFLDLDLDIVAVATGAPV